MHMIMTIIIICKDTMIITSKDTMIIIWKYTNQLDPRHQLILSHPRPMADQYEDASCSHLSQKKGLTLFKTV